MAQEPQSKAEAKDGQPDAIGGLLGKFISGQPAPLDAYYKLFIKSMAVGLAVGLVIAFLLINVFSVVKKPAIYLYPETPTQVSVHVLANGMITASEPDYGAGWSVLASPDGSIDGKYDYLFYEADLRKLVLPKEGWVVDYSGIGKWFDLMLPKLGLNEKESAQFKEYWLKALPPAKFYEIKLFSDWYLRENLALKITPEPDTLIRTEFYFRPLQEKEVLSEPVVVTPVRRGFVAVEWGGVLAQ
jgi:hypothetical protein